MQTPKEFILSNSPLFSEAIDNGYDIRMDESEILEWMRLYAAHVAKEIRHAAAEIALTIGETRTPEECHRDIMNLQIKQLWL